ncbi:hypothetical protein WA026_017432 [Henosepilachna vigintioctopunctata]|uniref:Uncharacterized protein n=1 Tax=Henosepilachna vigintioctopunctata TaxID=420089 RepID=A0AAW1V9D3_9CUCU
MFDKLREIHSRPQSILSARGHNENQILTDHFAPSHALGHIRSSRCLALSRSKNQIEETKKRKGGNEAHIKLGDERRNYSPSGLMIGAGRTRPCRLLRVLARQHVRDPRVVPNDALTFLGL